MKLTDLQANDLLTALKTVDGAGSGLDTDKVRGTNPFTANKNKIINGDMQVAQRGRIHQLENDSDYTIDRVKVTTDNNNAVEIRQELIYSVDEGAWKDTKDPFNDGSEKAFYKFEDNADDEHGDYNGTVNKSDFVSGMFGGKALYTNQDNKSYAEIDDIPKIFDETDKTLSIWVYFDEDTSLDTLISSAENSDKKEVKCMLDTSKLYVHEGSNINFKKPNYGWHHYLFTVSDNGTNIYIDSKKVAYDSRTKINNSSSKSYEAYAIGNSWYNIANNSNGAPNIIIDQLRIFNRALTEDEVRKLYVEDSKYIAKTHMRTNLMKKGDTYTVTPYEYRFEGQDIVSLMNDKAVLSFNLASSKNQDFTIRLKYPDGSEFKKKTITYNGNKEFTKHSVVFDMTELDVSKIPLDENLGLILTIGENDELDVGDFIRLTDIQFEVSEVATEFEKVNYITQLDRCMRYYEEWNEERNIWFGRTGDNYVYNSTHTKFKEKRTIPNISLDWSDSYGFNEFKGLPMTNNGFSLSLSSDDAKYNAYIRVKNVKIDAEL